MPIRDVLQTNLARLLEAARDGLIEGPATAHALAVQAKVPKTTVYEALKPGELRSAGVDVVERLAKAYGRPAWHLLVPDLDPKARLFLASGTAVEDEVRRRMKEIVENHQSPQVTEEQARAGPSVAYPYGAVQDARPEPPARKRVSRKT